MGNTVRYSLCRISFQDHPHGFGEYQKLMVILYTIVDAECDLIAGVSILMRNDLTALFRGSPPHTWGIPYVRTSGTEQVRITPTYMGNTARWWGQTALLRGSPPHTWGIPLGGNEDEDWWRITPTYMGNTGLSRSVGTTGEDHPHIHGEYTKRSLICRGSYIRKPWILMSLSTSFIVAVASANELCACSFLIPYLVKIVAKW